MIGTLIILWLSANLATALTIIVIQVLDDCFPPKRP